LFVAVLLAFTLASDLTKVGAAAAENPGKIAIVTNTVSVNEEEYRSAQDMVKRYGDRIVHVTWPDNIGSEQEQMITIVTKLGADSGIKALVLNQAPPGSNAAVDKLLEMRDDMLIIYCNYSENAPDVAKRADIGLLGNSMEMGARIADQSKKLGAKTLVHYSFPRHLSIPIFSVRRDKMKARAEELGIKFVEVTAPDPFSDAGTSGTQQFIMEDVPKKIEEYGKDTALTTTAAAVEIPIIKQTAEFGGIYPVPSSPSPFLGFPAALGIDVPDDKKSDVKFMIEKTREKLAEKGVAGRFSNLPVPGAFLLTNTAVEYSFLWLDGKTDGKKDDETLKKLMEDYAGVSIEFDKLEDNGVVYDNLLLYLMDFIVY
jgi:hypothetical protein